MPASKIPSTNRTPEAWWIVLTKAVAMDAMPKSNVDIGRNHPGPIHLQHRLQGISKRIYEM
jgi:hypothetical protein